MSKCPPWKSIKKEYAAVTHCKHVLNIQQYQKKIKFKDNYLEKISKIPSFLIFCQGIFCPDWEKKHRSGQLL